MTFFTSTVEEVGEYKSEFLSTLNWPPLHITSVTHKESGNYQIGCSCGWLGAMAYQLNLMDPIDVMAESFMEHKRLSAQVARRTKKFRKPPQ